MPACVTTVDKYQGQQNDFILLSLVRTEAVGHLRDIRRLVVAASRARLGLYIFCRQALFEDCFELKRTFDLLKRKPSALQLVVGEGYPTDRPAGTVPVEKMHTVADVTALGVLVYQMVQQAQQYSSSTSATPSHPEASMQQSQTQNTGDSTEVQADARE